MFHVGLRHPTPCTTPNGTVGSRRVDNALTMAVAPVLAAIVAFVSGASATPPFIYLEVPCKGVSGVPIQGYYRVL